MVLREEKAENTEKDKEGNLTLVKKEKCCSLCLCVSVADLEVVGV